MSESGIEPKSTKIAKQFDYKAVNFETPDPSQYRYAKIYPQNASQNATLPSGAVTPVTFELPTDVYNLSRAYLQYTVTLPATAGRVNITYKDLLSHINQIQLLNKNQVLIADLQNVALYTKAVWKQEIKYEDYKGFEKFSNGNGYGCMLMPCGAKSKNNLAALSAALLQTDDITPANIKVNTEKLFTYRVYPGISPNIGDVGNTPLKFTLSSSIAQTALAARANNFAAPAIASDQTPSNNIPYEEPQYFEIGTAVNNTTPIYNIRFPLRLLLNTIFALDKDLYFNGEIMYMKVFFNPSTSIYFTSNQYNEDINYNNGQSVVGNSVNGHPSSDLVATGGANNQSVCFTIAAAAGDVSLTNLTLWLPLNRDPDMKQSLQTYINQGKMKIPIPFVWTLNRSFAAVASAAGALPSSVSQNVTIKLNSSNGKRLQKIYYTLVNADGVAALTNLQYDISNLGYTSAGGQGVGVNALQSGYKVQQFQTFLDNKPLQDYIVNCTTGDHYTLQMPYLKGSVIMNSNMYDYNFCWTERFDNLISPLEKSTESPPEDNLVSGLDLSTERKYDFVSVCNPYFALNHYAFVVTQRDLHITPQGIYLDQTI